MRISDQMKHPAQRHRFVRVDAGPLEHAHVFTEAHFDIRLRRRRPFDRRGLPRRLVRIVDVVPHGMIVIGIAADIVRPARGHHEERLVAIGRIDLLQSPRPTALVLRVLLEQFNCLRQGLRVL